MIYDRCSIADEASCQFFITLSWTFLQGKIQGLIYSILFYRKLIGVQKCAFQGIILRNDVLLFIKQKHNRILFGKQWMRNKVKNNLKLSLNFSTGELKIRSPEILQTQLDCPFESSRTLSKVYSQVFLKFVQFFTTEIVPVIKKVIQHKNKSFKQIPSNDVEEQIQTEKNKEQNDQIQKMQKYLAMSMIIDTFSKDKESYKKLQQKILKQKEQIVKAQKNIDLTFSNLRNQLSLFTITSVNDQNKKLSKFNNFQIEERTILEDLCSVALHRTNFHSQQQFVLNCIGVLKIQNTKHFVSSGGSSSVCLIRIVFQYVFSDDPKFWIEKNKKTSYNILEKKFVIKQPKKGSQDKINHEIQIIRLMKGGFSVYLPKYYKILNMETSPNPLQSEDIILMDYLKGQTLGVYQFLHKETLSFWTKVFLVKNLLYGLRFISSYNITHLDFKPTNIIVTNDLLTKIIDFGQSHHPKLCKQNYSPGVSLPYSCPQLFYKKRINYDQKCDVFSLGVIMFQLFFQRQMFELSCNRIMKICEDQSYMKSMFLRVQGLQQVNIHPILNILLSLIMKCLDSNPQNRPTLNWISIIIGSFLAYFRGK